MTDRPTRFRCGPSPACLAPALLAAVLLGGCASGAELAQRDRNRSDPVFVSAYNGCVRNTSVFGAIPDFGITREQHFFKCMEQAGWVQQPRWNPQALGRYKRIEQQ